MLERLGCFVSGVGSGEQALELLANGGIFDLLLTDLGLPGMSGEELASEVRRQFPDLPVVIASGYGRTGNRAPCRLKACSSFQALFRSRPSTGTGACGADGDVALRTSFADVQPGPVQAFLEHLCSVRMGVLRCEPYISPKPRAVPGEPTRGPFEGELMDLYVAILIAVPLALFLKSL